MFVNSNPSVVLPEAEAATGMGKVHVRIPLPAELPGILPNE